MALPEEFYKVGLYERGLMLYQDNTVPEEGVPNILVRVEGQDDVDFWKRMLCKYAPNMNFHLKPYIRERSKKGKVCLKSGKQMLLKRYNYGKELNSRVILCLDSDYDFLLSDRDKVAKSLNENNFIFQTYVYSIENFRCLPESLNALCVQITQYDSLKNNFLKFFETYSITIYKLFLLLLFFEKKKRNNSRLSTKKFCNIVKIQNPKRFLNDPQAIIDELKQRVDHEAAQVTSNLEQHCHKVKNFEIEVASKGVTERNIYLFMKAKILNSFLEQVLPEIAFDIVNERIEEFKRLIAKNEKVRQTLNNYGNKLLLKFNYKKERLTNWQKRIIRYRVKLFLQTNYEHDKCELMKLIIKDIRKYSRRIEKTDKMREKRNHSMN